MAANDRLVIFRGDDTGGTFGRRLSFVITAAEGVSLDGCRAEWVFDGIVKEFAAPLVSGETREIFYSHNETRCMRPGVRFGTFRIVDAAGKVRTFDNTRPVEVTDSVSRCYPGSSSATVFVGTTVSWEQVSGKPLLVKTINGEPPGADGNIDVASGGTVKSATVNGGEKVTPTADGNLALTVPSSVESVNGKTGAVVLAAEDIETDGYGTVQDGISEANAGVTNVGIALDGHVQDGDIHVSGTDRENWEDKYSRDEVDEKINQFSAHYLTADAAGNAFAIAAELKSATAFYYAGELHTPDKNDYCIVRSDEDHKTSAGISPTTRYFYVGDVPGDGEWQYAYTVNETALTQSQINALDSGITASKVAEIDGKADEFSAWEVDGPSGPYEWTLKWRVDSGSSVPKWNAYYASGMWLGYSPTATHDATFIDDFEGDATFTGITASRKRVLRTGDAVAFDKTKPVSEQLDTAEKILTAAEDACKVNPVAVTELHDRDCSVVAYASGMTITFAASERLRSCEVLITGCAAGTELNVTATKLRGDSDALTLEDGDNHLTFAEYATGEFFVTRHVANEIT